MVSYKNLEKLKRTTNQLISMMIMIFVLLAILAYLVKADTPTGAAISPGCLKLDEENKCEFVNVKSGEIIKQEFMVLNFDGEVREFIVVSTGNLDGNIKIHPNKFEIDPFLNGKSRNGCTQEQGCQLINVEVDTTNLKPGKYEALILAGPNKQENNGLGIYHKVGARIMINVKPNFNFSSFFIKGLTNLLIANPVGSLLILI